MRQLSLGIVLVAAIAAGYALSRWQSYARTRTDAAQRVLYYVDPMHPSYRSDKPGIAPDCGMSLVPVFTGERDARPSSTLPQATAGAVRIDRPTQQSVGVRLAPVERSSVISVIQAVGRVSPEDVRIYKINSGVDGFIRETYDDSVGTLVRKDQKLATYYAPEFLAAASGFLAASERVPGAVSKEGARSLQNYTDRLRNLGMSDVQIKRMAGSGKLPETIDVVAPAQGFILARNISAGQHFEHDMEFYRVADLSQVWVIAEVDVHDATYLRPGASAHITFENGRRRLPARITKTLPQSEAGGGTVKVRLEVDNPVFRLRPDMLVDVALTVCLPPAITVPVDALVDSGARARVYVEHGEGVFEPREVQTGWRFGERVEITHGVELGERVVVAATFLVDSESRLRAPASATVLANATPNLRHAAATVAFDANCGMSVETAKALASGNTLTYPGRTYYFCSRRCKETFQAQRTALQSGHRPTDDD